MFRSCGGHLAGEHVRLQLLREHRAPHVLRRAWRCRRALALRDRRSSPQGRSRTCHSCALRELVEAENAGERLALLAFLVDDLLGRHRWQLKLRGPMDVRKWPRKNDPESIRARQEALGLDGEVTGDRPRALRARAGDADRRGRDPGLGRRPARARARRVRAARAGRASSSRRAARRTPSSCRSRTPEGGLSASLHRGARAVAESGGFRTYVLADRITRASCFVCGSAAEAIELARWIDGELDAMRALARRAGRPVAVEARAAARGEDARRRPDVPRALALDDRATRSART